MTEQEKQAVETLTRSFTRMETIYKVKCMEVEAREEEISRLKAENAELQATLSKMETVEKEHRAEVAERALNLAVSNYMCVLCPCYDCDASICGTQECIEMIIKAYKAQAEKELAEGKKNE